MENDEVMAAFEKLSATEQGDIMQGFMLDVLDLAKKRGVPGLCMLRAFGVMADGVAQMNIQGGMSKIEATGTVVNVILSGFGFKRMADEDSAAPDSPPIH